MKYFYLDIKIKTVETMKKTKNGKKLLSLSISFSFYRPCHADDGEVAPPGMPADRKTSGYSTVTHFNLVHVDCHMAALRLQRGRDEWESAMLQNANTKCNGLLPLWGPQV